MAQRSVKTQNAAAVPAAGGGGILVYSGGINAPVLPPLPLTLLDPILQRLNTSPPDTSFQLVSTRTGTLQRLKVLVISNVMVVAVTITLRVNAVDTGVSVVIPGGATGVFTSGATAAIVEDDLISVGLSQVGSGAGVAILVTTTHELV